MFIFIHFFKYCTLSSYSLYPIAITEWLTSRAENQIAAFVREQQLIYTNYRYTYNKKLRKL